jgi:hypothetical protein
MSLPNSLNESQQPFGPVRSITTRGELPPAGPYSLAPTGPPNTACLVAQGLSSASGGGNGGTDVASKDNETNKHHDEMAPVDEHKDLVLDQDVLRVHAAVLRSLKSRKATCSMQRATLMSSQLPFEVHATHLAVLCGGYVPARLSGGGIYALRVFAFVHACCPRLSGCCL